MLITVVSALTPIQGIILRKHHKVSNVVLDDGIQSLTSFFFLPLLPRAISFSLLPSLTMTQERERARLHSEFETPMMKLTPSFIFLGLWEGTVRPTYTTGTSAIFSLNYSNIFSLSRKGVVRVQYLPYEIRKNPTNHCLQPIPLNQDGWIDVCGQTDTMCLKHWPRHKGALATMTTTATPTAKKLQ